MPPIRPVKKHRLVGADFQSAYDWYEAKQPGVGSEFIEDFRHAYYRLRKTPLFYSIRFANARRLNLERFPYGIFYTVNAEEIRILAILHSSRDSQNILASRRRAFH
jgi:plasmid stabilization system protein ParE